MKSLIDPTQNVSRITSWTTVAPITPIYEPYPNSARICQVEPDDAIFGVGEPLYWETCPDDCVADYFWCDLTTNTISKIDEAPPKPLGTDQPNTTGTQTL